MTSKLAVLLLLINILAAYSSIDLQRSGDVIIGQLLPVSQSSGDQKCAVPALGNIIKIEALIYAINRLNTEDKLKIGYDIIDSCSNTSTSDRINFATRKWFQEEKNSSRIPIAVITDLNDRREFHQIARERNNRGKKMPLLSLQNRNELNELLWNDTYYMSPAQDAPQRAIYEFVHELGWNILDIVKYNNDDGFNRFKKISKDGEKVCLLNELSFVGKDFKWSKKGQKDAPAVVLFAKQDKIPSIIDELARYNLSEWNIILGNQVPEGNHRWANNMIGVVGIRRNHGNLKGFKEHLEGSKVFGNAVGKIFCPKSTVENCYAHQERILRENIHLGASVIDAVYAVVKSLQSGSNRLPKTGLTGIRVISATGRVVSFDSKDSVIKEIVYDVLNFQGKKFVKVGRIEYNTPIKILRTDKIIWKRSPQGNCSANCEPGTWRKPWEDVGRCCWDCVPCDTGTVSSYHNSPWCRKCPTGTKPTAGQDKCQPPYIDYLRWHDPFSLVMIFLLTFTICFLVYTVNVYVKKANTPVFLKSKSASLPLLLSLFLTFVLPIILLMKPTQSSCGAYNAIFMFSLGIPLTFLIARSHVVFNYCYGDDGDTKRKWFRCSPQNVISLILIILQLIIVVVVLSLAPPKVLTLDTSEPDVEYIECASHSRPEFLPVVFFILVLIMAFNILHMNEESSPVNQNEVKFVSLGIFIMYTILFIYFVAVFGINGKKKIRILCGMAYLFGLNFFVTIFLPKIYVIIYHPEKNLPDVARLLKDENCNRDASRFVDRECIGSPLLGLQAGPYDRTEV